MPIATHESLITTFTDVSAAHECSYAERVVAIDTQLGLGLASSKLLALSDMLADLHAGGQCPPVAVDNSPTKEWSDWVRATRR